MILLRKKTKRNRRVWRDSYLLEVKTPMNRRFSRQAAWLQKMAPWAGLALLLSFSALTIWHFLGRRLFTENPQFKVRVIEATTDGVIPPPELARWTAVTSGQNLVKVDVTAIKKRLESVALIREAQVSKVFPDRLVVRVSERKAMARFTPQGAGAAVYFVDNAGVAFAAVRGSDGKVYAPYGAAARPTLIGIRPDQVTLGQKIRSEGAREALEVIRLCEQMGMMPLMDLRGVDVSQPPTLKLVLGRGGIVYLDSQNIETQLKRLHVIVWRARNERREVRTADMRPARNVAVTYF